MFLAVLCKAERADSQNLSLSLTACYNFNGNTMDAVNGLNGGYIGSTLVPVPDRFNKDNCAIKPFAGSSVTILPGDPLLLPASDITFSGWVRFNTLSMYAPVVLTRNHAVTSTTNNMGAYQVALTFTNGIFTFVASKAGPSLICTAAGTTQVTQFTWYHVAFTMDNTSIKLYVNGNLESTAPSTFNGFDYTGAGPTLGYVNEPGFQSPMNGYIDNFRFYNRVLSAIEINQLYVQDPDCFSPPSPPSCSLYYALSCSAIYACTPGSAPSPTYVNIPIPSGASGITIGSNFGFPAPNPTYWISAGGTLWYFDGTAFVNTNHTHGHQYAHSLGAGSNHIYCLDWQNSNVYKYDGTGNASFVATNTAGPVSSDIVGDDQDNYWMQNASSKDLMKYTPAGVNICGLSNITSFWGFEEGLAVVENSVQSIGSAIFNYSKISPPYGALAMANTNHVQAGINDLGCCPMTTSLTVSLTPQQVSVSCANPSATIEVVPSLNDFFYYSWTGPFTSTPAVFSATASGVYTITLSGCRTPGATLTCNVSSVNVPLTLTPTPVTASLCLPGNSATLSVLGALAYTWTPATGLSSTTGSLVNANPAVSTVYTITGQTTNTCIGTATIEVDPEPVPVLTVSASDQSICPGQFAGILLNGAVGYTLEPGQLTGSANIVQPAATTIYTATGVSSKGCEASTQFTINVLDCSGLGELDQAEIKIWPNPCSGQLNIRGGEFFGSEYSLMQLTGEVLLSGNIKEDRQIDISALPKGIYLLQIKNQAKGNAKALKLIRE